MSDTNQAVQSHKQARSLKFQVYEEERFHYPCSENKDTDQLCSYCTADLCLCFRLCIFDDFLMLRLKCQTYEIFFSWELSNEWVELSRIVRKPDFCLCRENKGADQLRGNREADQRLCFRHSDSTIPLLLIAKISSI